MLGSLGAVRRIAACLLAIGLGAAVPMPASAHAELVESSPPANASLVEAPEALALTFSEPIDPATAVVELLDEQQSAVPGLGELRVSDGGTSATASLPDLEPGVYTVSYQVVSTVDGHATAGILAFLIDPSGAAPPPTDSASSSSPSVDPFTVAARWLALAMMLVALGTVVLWWNAGRAVLGEGGAAPSGPPWILIGGASLLAALGIAGYLLLSARPISDSATGTGIPLDIAAPFGWTPFAIAMRVAFIAAVLAGIASLLAAVNRGSSLRPLVAVSVLLAAGLAGMSMAAHAAASGGPAFAAIDWLHLLGAAAWLGALPAALLLGVRAGRGSLAAILRRHGRVALVAAPVVALTGIANSPLVLGDARNLVASDYGNLLVAKAGLLSVAVGIGAVNHLALRGRGRAAVATLVAAELVVAVFAVSAAATMVTIQAASARQPELATTPVNPAHLFGEVGPSRVHVSVSVPAPGDQAYRVLLSDAATGGPRDDVQKVFVELTPPEASDLPTERVELAPEGGPRTGLWVANGTFTPIVGDWELAVVVRRTGERDESLAFELPVTTPGTPELRPPPDTGVGVPAPVAAAWSLLPAGLLGWAPPVTALVAVGALGFLPRSTLRGFARGAAVAVLLVTTAAAGSRAIVAAANAPGDEELARATAVDDGSAERGEAIYRANCASCHGIEADGNGPVTTYPDAGPLQDAVDAASDAELSYRIAYGIAGTPMPAFAGLLTPEERADVIAYLRQRAR